MSDSKLHLSDYEMEEHHVPALDLVWGFKSYRNAQNFVRFALEARYRQPGFEDPIYVRISTGDDPVGAKDPSTRVVVKELMEILARLLTEPAYRLEVAEYQKENLL